MRNRDKIYSKQEDSIFYILYQIDIGFINFCFVKKNLKKFKSL